MVIPLVLVVLPLGLLFILSGLIVNAIQAILFVPIRPSSKSLYRRINRFLVELLWLQLIWIVDWWACVKRWSILMKEKDREGVMKMVERISRLLASNAPV